MPATHWNRDDECRLQHALLAEPHRQTHYEFALIYLLREESTARERADRRAGSLRTALFVSLAWSAALVVVAVCGWCR